MRILWRTLLVVFSIVLLLPNIPVKANNNLPLPKKRIVTLIYDDSGSMKQGVNRKPIDNWKYANYALQSLIGLLDSNDLLYTVRMSDPLKSIKLSLGEKRQAEIESIRSWSSESGTPIDTVFTAMNQINRLTEEYPEAEYWMILLTDGLFEELYPVKVNDPIANPTPKRVETETTLRRFTQALDEKGLPFNSALVTIESYLTPKQKEYMGDFKMLWKDSTKGSVIESESQEHIVESINKVAALITNRDPDETKVFDLNANFVKDGVTLTSPFPLRRITVLNQSRDENSEFMIEKVDFNGESQKNNIEGPYIIHSPVDPEKISPPIKGSITHIKQGNLGEVIPEGMYQLHFSDDLTEEQKRNLRFLAEPAVDFNLHVKKVNMDGTETDDSTTFFPESKMYLDVELIQSHTKKPILLDKVNKDIFNLSIQLDDETIPVVWDEKRKVFSSSFILPKKESLEAKVKVQIEGLYQKEKTTKISTVPFRKLELKRANNTLWSARVNELEKGKPIKIIPMINGKEMTEEELAEVIGTLKVNSGEHQIEYDIQQNSNHIFLKPKIYKSILMTSTGTIPVHLTMNGKHPQETASLDFTISVINIPISQKYGPYILWGLLVVLIIVYLVGLFVRDRFAKDRISLTYKRTALVNGQKINGQPSTEDFYTNWFERWLVPYKAEKKSIQGIVFKASSKPDKVILLKQSQMENMIVAGEKLGEEAGKKDKTIFSNDEIKIETHTGIEIYIFKTS